MKKTIFILTSILIILYTTNGYCFRIPILSDIKKLFDQEVEKTSRNMAAGVRVEFEKTMEDLFDKNIRPIVNDISVLMESGMEDADKIAKERLSQLETIIMTSIKEIDIRTNRSIEITRKKIDELRKKVHNDVEDILSKVECLEDKIVRDMNYISDYYGNMIKHLNLIYLIVEPPCFKKLGISNYPKAHEYAMIFYLIKCEKEKSLNPDTPVQTILNTYLDLRNLASRTICIQRHAGASNKHIVDEWVQLGERYDTWYTINNLD